MGANTGLPSRVAYAAYNTDTQQFVDGDGANHTISLTLDGTTAPATNAPTGKGNGVYEIVLTAAERLGQDLSVGGVSSTANIIIVPIHYSADGRWNELLEDDGGGNLRNTSKSLEEAPDSVADISGVALETSVQQVLSTGGEGPWKTATGFATPEDLSDLALEASVQLVLTTGGAGPWTTATGFTTPGDLSELALEDSVQAVKAVTDLFTFYDMGGGNFAVISDVEVFQSVDISSLTKMIVDGGTSEFQWSAKALELAPDSVADISNLALEASVQLVLTTGGTGPWTTGAGGGAEKDWTDTERSQIRKRLGVDGDAAAPAATPDLALETSVQQVLTVGGAGPWTSGSAGNVIYVGVTAIEPDGYLTVLRGDTFTFPILLDVNLASVTDVVFAIKENTSDPDAESLLLISSANGLLYVNKAAPDAAENGAVTIEHSGSGLIRVTCKAVEMAKLPQRIRSSCSEVQLLFGEDVLTRWKMKTTIAGDVVRATS